MVRTCTYTFAGKTVAQRTAAGGASKLMFLVSDSVDTTQTVVLPTDGATLAKAVTRFTDPSGLARGATQTATGAGAYSIAPTATTGVGSNAANPTGFSAVNGYIAGLADTTSALTHLGARDLDPVLGAFTAPDTILDTENSAAFTPYAYSANDPINYSDPSGLFSWGDIGKWVHDNAGTIANVATAIVVTAVVFTAATACVASVVCGIGVAVVAGAIGATAGYIAGNAVDVAVGNKPAPSAQEYWAGMGQAAALGAVTGGAGGGAGAIAGKAAPYLGRWIGNAVTATRNTATAAAPRLIAAARQAAAKSAEYSKSLGQSNLARASMPPSASVPPSSIRFSQTSVNDAAEIIDSMKAKGWRGEAIDAVRMPDGGLTTVDNTLLLAAHRAGINVRANIRGFDEQLSPIQANRLTTRKGIPETWGDNVRLRIGKQGSSYRSKYPSGSSVTGWTGTDG